MFEIINTPWGMAQHQQKIADGVHEVDTPGHGGILVDVAVATQFLSQEAIAKGWRWGRWYAYEEDCDWAIFGYEQPDLYAATHTAPRYKPHTAEEIKQIARECLARWHPEYLAQKEGEKGEVL